jgi:hypothetical protein
MGASLPFFSFFEDFSGVAVSPSGFLFDMMDEFDSIATQGRDTVNIQI